MTTDVTTRVDLVPYIVRAHGDLALAAEYARIDRDEFIAQLHTVDPARLTAALQIAHIVLTYETLVEVKTAVIGTLGDLPPTAASRLMMDLFDHFSGLVASKAPVQSGSASNGQMPQNVFNIFQQMQSVAETVDDELTKRFNTFDVPATTPSVPRTVDSRTEDDSSVRLEPDGEAGTT